MRGVDGVAASGTVTDKHKRAQPSGLPPGPPVLGLSSWPDRYHRRHHRVTPRIASATPLKGQY